MPINDEKPVTPGWFWKKVEHDIFITWGPEHQMLKHRRCDYVKSIDGNPPFSFWSYADMCWWLGSRGINPTEQGSVKS